MQKKKSNKSNEFFYIWFFVAMTHIINKSFHVENQVCFQKYLHPRTFLQCSSKSILSLRHVVPGVFMFKSVVHRPSSDKCCGWYDWPASHNTAICGSHRGDAACKCKKRDKIVNFQRGEMVNTSIFAKKEREFVYGWWVSFVVVWYWWKVFFILYAFLCIVFIARFPRRFPFSFFSPN